MSNEAPPGSNIRLLRPASEIRRVRLHEWVVDATTHGLTRAGVEIRITPKAMAILNLLILQEGKPLSRNALLSAVWPRGVASDDLLTHVIKELRRALEDDPKNPRYIETIPKVGYRLVAPISELPDITAAPKPIAKTSSSRWSKSAVLSIALACVAVCVVFLLSLDVNGARTALSGSAQRRLASIGSTPAVAPTPTPITAEPSREEFPAFSPDGTTVAYSAAYPGDESARIYLRSVSGSPALRISSGEAGGPGDLYPVWSPDGAQIAFLKLGTKQCSIIVVSALGGREKKVGACYPRALAYFDWAPGGDALIVMRKVISGETYVGPSRIHFLSLRDGSADPLPYDTDATEDDVQPRCSPDGTRIAFRRGASPYSDIYWTQRSGGQVHRVTNLRSRMRGFSWLPDGRHILFASDHAGRSDLYVVAIEDGSIKALGVHDATSPHVASRRTIVTYEQDASQVNLFEFDLKAGAQTKGNALQASTRHDSWPAFSPLGDGRVAFVSDRSGESQLWMHDPNTSEAYQLTRGNGWLLSDPNWSSDGARIVFSARSAGSSALKNIDIGTGAVSDISEANENVRYGTYSKDGNWVFFVSDRSGSWQLWRRALAGGPAEQLSRSGARNVQAASGGDAVYYTHANAGGLVRLDLASRNESLAGEFIDAWNLDAWKLADDGVYFLYVQPDGKTGLTFTRLTEDKSDLILLLEPTTVPQLALSPDRTRAIVPVVVRDDTDVMMLDIPDLDLLR